MSNNNTLFIFSDNTYAVGKKLQVILPSVAALYFGVAVIWALPAALTVVGTLAGITTFLGLCLDISAKHYDASDVAYDGQLVVIIPEDGPKVFALELDGDPEELEHKKSITFKVGPRRESIEEPV